MNKMNEIISLPDGRRLGYARYGDINGKPIFFFHGIPSSRLTRHPDDGLTAALGVHLVTVDRPGFGLSDYQPNRQLLDWPDDVTILADTLGIQRFTVAGISGGGPYATACAYKIPHRITATGIISGVGPTDVLKNLQMLSKIRRGGVFLARYAPGLLRPMIWLLQNPQRDLEKYYRKTLTELSISDQVVLHRPEVKLLIKQTWKEGTRKGVRGFTRDGIILSHPWGFQLDDIRGKVFIWHGDQDTSTPLAMAEYLAERIPNCHLKILPGEGHFLLFDHWKEILTTLTTL